PIAEETLQALAEQDYDAVRRYLDALPKSDEARMALVWAYAHSGAMGLRELVEARALLRGWPGDARLADLEEAARANSLFGLNQLLQAARTRPATNFSSAVRQARLHMRADDAAAARAVLLPYWIDQRLSAADERLIINEFADAFETGDHARRYFNMMSRDRIASGSRLVDLAEMEPVHDAWVALIRGRRSVASLLEAVPEAYQATTAYKFIAVEALRRRDAIAEAADALLAASADPDIAINPNAWWTERRIVSRSLREAGDLEKAYAVASAHRGGSNQIQIEAAFHAGWYALQLDNAEDARGHFATIVEIAETPISKARGAYWLARALTALDRPEDAQTAYAQAAVHETSFYGLLAGEALGDEQPIGEQPEAVDETELMEAFLQAAALFAQSDNAMLVRRFSETLARDDAALPHGRAAAHWLVDNDFAFDGVRLAKAAHRAGHFWEDALYPTGIVTRAAVGSDRDVALAHAIARQESEFRVDARSSADALGLMQLLPSTARAEARRLDVSYRTDLLTSNPDYNARLGLSYIDRQLDRFDGSFVLALVAYNAGPGRARDWVARFGSPVGLDLHETIDWIEQIPFPETRNYVFRVLENYAVYRKRLEMTGSLGNILTRGHPAF
ncbi:MAG: lytic transglycosylase domain-containing protein, partial [Pseudomonadota bacterium]